MYQTIKQACLQNMSTYSQIWRHQTRQTALPGSNECDTGYFFTYRGAYMDCRGWLPRLAKASVCKHSTHQGVIHITSNRFWEEINYFSIFSTKGHRNHNQCFLLLDVYNILGYIFDISHRPTCWRDIDINSCGVHGAWFIRLKCTGQRQV